MCQTYQRKWFIFSFYQLTKLNNALQQKCPKSISSRKCSTTSIFSHLPEITEPWLRCVTTSIIESWHCNIRFSFIWFTAKFFVAWTLEVQITITHRKVSCRKRSEVFRRWNHKIVCKMAKYYWTKWPIHYWVNLFNCIKNRCLFHNT